MSCHYKQSVRIGAEITKQRQIACAHTTVSEQQAKTMQFLVILEWIPVSYCDLSDPEPQPSRSSSHSFTRAGSAVYPPIPCLVLVLHRYLTLIVFAFTSRPILHSLSSDLPLCQGFESKAVLVRVAAIASPKWGAKRTFWFLLKK